VPPLLYRELVPWYDLIDPVDDHADEGALYGAAFERAVSPRPERCSSSAPARATTRTT
jgi:hypothetical protein